MKLITKPEVNTSLNSTDIYKSDRTIANTKCKSVRFFHFRKMAYKTVICILIISLALQPANGWLYTIGAGIVGVIAAPIAVPAALGAIGFSAGGIVGGSVASSMMATYGGSVAAGSAVAVAQSVGAAGLGLAGQVAAGAIGAAGGAVYEKYKCEND